jgi:hypothetical protein
MIKKYNQFVKENKTNEEFVIEPKAPAIPSLGNRMGTETKPATPITTPDTPTRPRPTRPGIAPTEIPSEQDAPLASIETEDEEVGSDKYTSSLQSLADAAGVDFVPEEKSVTIKGKKVIFPTETEKYHVEGVKKPFATLEEVLSYFESDSRANTPERQETRDEMTSLKDETVLDEVEQFESKSYKSKRIKRK